VKVRSGFVHGGQADAQIEFGGAKLADLGVGGEFVQLHVHLRIPRTKALEGGRQDAEVGDGDEADGERAGLAALVLARALDGVFKLGEDGTDVLKERRRWR
jgi:hypothetical protein